MASPYLLFRVPQDYEGVGVEAGVLLYVQPIAPHLCPVLYLSL